MIYQDLDSRFDKVEEPDWYQEAISYLRGEKDQGNFGLFLYYLIREIDNINTVLNIGTARGYSTVCAAKAIQSKNRSGEVHTIDIKPPDYQEWGRISESDPLNSKQYSMRDLVSRFHNPSDESVPIKFHTGDSNKVLQKLDISPDLVFHDGRHTYNAVKNDIQTANNMSDKSLIQVFDDCYLYTYDWSYRPLSSGFFHRFDDVPKLGGALKRIRTLKLVKEPDYPGITEAVNEFINLSEWKKIEIISDQNHAPITAIYL